MRILVELLAGAGRLSLSILGRIVLVLAALCLVAMIPLALGSLFVVLGPGGEW